MATPLKVGAIEVTARLTPNGVVRYGTRVARVVSVTGRTIVVNAEHQRGIARSGGDHYGHLDPEVWAVEEIVSVHTLSIVAAALRREGR